MLACSARRKAAGAALGAALLMALASPALAADIRGGTTITVSPDETIRDDLYVAANTVIVDGTIEGDLFAAARTVIVNGRVTGGVFAGAYDVDIAGRVDGDLRVGAVLVTIRGPVAGDLLAAGDRINLETAGTVGRDALLAGGSIVVNGRVGRNVRGAGGTLQLDAPVGGGIELYGVDQLSLGRDARVGGDVRFESKHELYRDPGAQVQGQIVRREPAPERGPDPFERILGTLFGILAVTVVGTGVLALATGPTLAAGNAVVRQPLLSLAWGFGLLVGIPVGAVLLLLTIVGIPLAVITVLIYAIVLYVAQAIVGLGLGQLLLAQLRPVDGFGWSVVSILVGTVILAALRLVPYLDTLVMLVVLILGLGAIWLTYLETRMPTSAHPMSATPPVASA